MTAMDLVNKILKMPLESCLRELVVSGTGETYNVENVTVNSNGVIIIEVEIEHGD